jgi:hypothetical protein
MRKRALGYLIIARAYGTRPMRVLCVAEKPSIAKSITEILSGGRKDVVSARLRGRCQVGYATLAYPPHSVEALRARFLTLPAELWPPVHSQL